MSHRLTTSLTLPVTRDVAFAFFADAGNLQRITPPELRFRILTPLPIAMNAGQLIEYRLRLYGVPFDWRTRIARWEPPTLFVDEQLRGPFREWIHTHRFAEVATGTEVSDEVRYGLPAWPLGELALPLVRRQLQRIFSYRRRRITELLRAPR